MHNNYYFLKHLTSDLRPRLKGAKVIECFSQNKDELIIELETKTESFYIKAHLSPSFCCLSFPNQFHRARKNSVSLFDEIINSEIVEISVYENERAFFIELNNSFTLIFKLHGNRSNILLAKDNKVEKIFINRLKNDLCITPSALNRPIEQSLGAFIDEDEEIKKLFPTFNRELIQYFHEKTHSLESAEEKWNIAQSIVSELEQKTIFITSDQLSLIPINGSKEYHDSIEALNAFFNSFISNFHLNKNKKEALNRLNAQLKKGSSYVNKTEQKLKKLESNASYRIFGDLIMANMHQISSGCKVVTLSNFYDNNKPLTIPLKRTLSPQKNAELFYKKAKNQDIEVSTLKKNIDLKKEQLDHINELIVEISKSEDFKQLKSLLGEITETQKEKEILPYNEYNYKGFTIWVGKSAKANDKMLQRAFKDDLWLHAKDVSGSHVIIKYKSEAAPSSDVKEKVAQLAAYYSKRKSDSLCPVIITPRKYVRKRKGDPPGAVVVEKEETLLVKPEKFKA